MYKIEKTYYGFKIINSGSWDLKEAEEFQFSIISKLSECIEPFSLFVDLRKLVPLTPEVLNSIKETRMACKNMSIERAAYVVSSPVIKGQTTRLSLETHKAPYDRVINAAITPDWEQQAIEWIVEAKEPLTLSKSTNITQ